jgi:hypothetical protein
VTAYKDVYLVCDYRPPKCWQQFRAVPELGFPTVAVVRREGRKAGWTLVRSTLGRSFDKDYCPDHPEGRELVKGDGGPTADSRPA